MTYNFSAGPAMIPVEVMHKAQAEFLDWGNIGTSIMEVSHRSAEFISIAEESEAVLRELLSISDDYHVLFLAGGAQLQFAGIPMNLLGDKTQVCYAETGTWSHLACEEAAKYAEVVKACDTSATNFTTVPAQKDWTIAKDAAYFYYCDNETVHGVEFHDVPDVGLPLVCDMSSNLLTRAVDVSKFGLIYACAQKNLGPAGITIVIVHRDLLKRQPNRFTPSVMDYRIQRDRGSMRNTPVTYSWYMTNLVLKWIRDQGGVDKMQKRAHQRSKLLYDYIDSSDFYHCPVDPNYRSRINVVFDVVDPARLDGLLKEARAQGLLYLKGHKTRGGLRASLYNAMPIAGVEALITFLKEFALVKV